MWPFKKKETRNNKTLDQLLEVGSSTTSGQHVNAQTAQNIAAVHCAVATISESVASLPIHVYQKQNGNKERLSNYVERLINVNPNGYMTAYDFKIALLRSVLLRGNAFALIDYDGSGKPSSLHWLHPDSVIVKKLPNNRLGYQVTFEAGNIRTLHQEEIIHIKVNSDDGIIGQSPISVCRDSIGIALAQEEHISKIMKNGAMPKGLLETDNVFQDRDAATRLRVEFDERYAGTNNSGKTVLLENGLKYKPLTISPADTELLASRSFSVAEVARAFKISPLLLQDLSHGTYSNFSEAQRAYLHQTLRPWLTNLQQAFNSRLVAIRNQANTFIEFETKDLLRASTEERFSAYDVAIRNGIMCPNDARKAENMPLRHGGDEFSQSWLNNQLPKQKVSNDE